MLIPLEERWKYPYLCTETEPTLRKCHLKFVPRPTISRKKAMLQMPWFSLHATPTDTSWKRCALSGPARPVHVDELDFPLRSPYNQSTEWLHPVEDTMLQPETVAVESGTRQCRPPHPPPPRAWIYNHPIFISEVTERATNINNVPLAIECPHISQTNNGYARKMENGTFYRS